MIERSNDAEKSERAYWFEDTPTLDPALSAQLPEHVPTVAQPEPKRRKLAEKYERILDRAKTMRRTSMEMRVFEDDMETIIAALRASQPSPAATVDLTNHHNALKCPYCNPKGLQFAEPHEGCSAATEGCGTPGCTDPSCDYGKGPLRCQSCGAVVVGEPQHAQVRETER